VSFSARALPPLRPPSRPVLLFGHTAILT
jgi:hypothetical protein